MHKNFSARNRLIHNGLVCLLCLFVLSASAQETQVWFKEADNLERQLKEPEALDKYKQILVAEPNSLKALVKATELSCSTGERLTAKTDKRLAFESALAFANRAIAAAPAQPDAWYALSLASFKMTEVETENKKIAVFYRDSKTGADKALQLQPAHAMGNFMEGRWHYEVYQMSGARRLAIKAIYGGLAEPSLDSAITCFENCRRGEPYFMLNYLCLAKAYHAANRPALEIEVLNRLVKLPIRTPDDAALKAEGQKMLDANL